MEGTPIKINKKSTYSSDPRLTSELVLTACIGLLPEQNEVVRKPVNADSLITDWTFGGSVKQIISKVIRKFDLFILLSLWFILSTISPAAKAKKKLQQFQQ